MDEALLKLLEDTVSRNDSLSIISVLVSFSAIIVSLASVFISKRSLVNKAITSNRIEWINSVRGATQEYIYSYIFNQFHEKRIAQSKILLYLRHDVKIYRPYIDALANCTNDESYNEKHLVQLINCCQDMLNDVWNRMKREAGVSKRAEKRLKQKLKDDKNRSLPY